MSHQYQYQQQPGGQFPTQQPGPYGPPPRKKAGLGKILGLGCGGVVGLLVVVGIISAVASGGGGDSSDASKPAATTSQGDGKGDSAKTDKNGKAAADPKKDDGAKSSKTVTFKVWGTAPAGDLGSLDIQYGTDSDTRKGQFRNGRFEATLPVDKDVMYVDITAQLQGSGDIQCSVTVGGKTKTGHASGGYNICDAQLTAGLFGGWES